MLERIRAALVGRYDLEREIGSGGMATVYLAQDVKHQRRVAVKVLRPELAATLGPDRFFREIQIAAQLQHPHILPLLDSGDAQGFLYYVMPFVEGESLRERLSRRGELPVHEAVKVLVEVSDALAHAHRRGVVHRDIKPDNVMLSERHALVTDFGVAKAVSEATGRNKLTTAGVALGTPAYMAPEQAAADPHIDHRVDIYAIGAMAYELLSGRPPFTGGSSQEILAAHVTQAPQPITARRAACPPALAAVVMRCLEKRPADRWQTADELLAQLEPLATPSGGVTPTQTQPTTAVAAPGGWYGHPLRVVGLFLLASVAVLGVVYFLTIQLGLPFWVLRGAAVLLLLGLPIMVATGLVERRRARLRATGRHTVSAETPIRGLFTWRRAVMGGVWAFAGLGVVSIGYTAMRLLGIGPVGTLVASGKLAERDRIIVAEFDNHAADSTLGQSVTEAFRIDLAQSPVVNVLGGAAVSDAMQRMNLRPGRSLDDTTAREVALREGVKGIVVGDISPIGKGLVLSARVLAAVDGSELVAVRETADDESQVLPAIDRLSRRIRERIGESLRTIRANEPLEQVTTGSLEALRLYSEGARASDAGETSRAVSLLQQAIALDSGFAMAWRKLAVALYNSRGSGAQAVAAATKAYQHRDRLTEVERYQTTAYYFLSVDYKPEQAISSYRAILELKPDDPIAPNNLALTLELERRYAEAEPIAQRYVDQGGSGNIFAQLVIAKMGQGKTAEARADLKEWARRDSVSAFRHVVTAGFFAGIHQYDSARGEIQAVPRVSQDPAELSLAAISGSAVALSEGRLGEAERRLHDFEDLGERRGVPQNSLLAGASLARIQATFRGDPGGAVRILDAALARRPVAGLDPLDRPYMELAAAYAIAGQPARARSLLREMAGAVPAGLPEQRHNADMAPGYIALAEGHAAEAITAFRAWWNESSCSSCAQADLGRAYDLAGQRDSAIAAYRRAVDGPTDILAVLDQQWSLAYSYRRLGELYEEEGDRRQALDYYGRFVNQWKNADPELQPAVRDVRERMAKLAGEGK
jgi:eukaryotic-like serine/threonine-protein kinase